MAASLTIGDLAREPGDVARGLPEWDHGDREGAILRTLAASARSLHEKRYTLWVWAGRSQLGDPVWVLPVTASEVAAFWPRAVARVLAATLQVAIRELDVASTTVRLRDWHGRLALVLPGLLEDLAGEALELAHPPPARARLALVPPDLPVEGRPLVLAPGAAAQGTGLARMARELHRHPVEVAAALAGQGYDVDVDDHLPELVTALRAQGLGEAPPPEPERAPSLAIEDDPCPRRRHARVVLQRMLRMGKVGPGYHTEFDHFSRGAAAHDRRQALVVGEALLRAGLLIEKPSVGQRHISLNVRALPEIHALIERGETDDPQLAELWSAPAPSATRK